MNPLTWKKCCPGTSFSHVVYVCATGRQEKHLKLSSGGTERKWRISCDRCTHPTIEGHRNVQVFRDYLINFIKHWMGLCANHALKDEKIHFPHQLKPFSSENSKISLEFRIWTRNSGNPGGLMLKLCHFPWKLRKNFPLYVVKTWPR